MRLKRIFRLDEFNIVEFLLSTSDILNIDRLGIPNKKRELSNICKIKFSKQNLLIVDPTESFQNYFKK